MPGPHQGDLDRHATEEPAREDGSGETSELERLACCRSRGGLGASLRSPLPRDGRDFTSDRVRPAGRVLPPGPQHGGQDADLRVAGDGKEVSPGPTPPATPPGGRDPTPRSGG